MRLAAVRGARTGSAAGMRMGLSAALGLLFLYLALRGVAYADVGAALMQASPVFIGLALISVAVNTAAKAARWRVLLGPEGRGVPFARILGGLLVGQMLNTVVPVRLGDVSRAYTLGPAAPADGFILGTVVLEKLLDMVAYGLLFAVLLLLMPLPAWIGFSAFHLALVTAGLGALVAVLVYRRGWALSSVERLLGRAPAVLGPAIVRRLRDGVASLEILRSRPDLIKLVLWSVLIWGSAVLNNHLVLLALHLRLPVAASVLLLVVLQAGISLPSTPGTLGVFEYLCVLALAIFAVARTLAFSYGVLLHSIVMLPPLFAGLFLFGHQGRASRRDLPTPPRGQDGGHATHV